MSRLNGPLHLNVDNFQSNVNISDDNEPLEERRAVSRERSQSMNEANVTETASNTITNHMTNHVTNNHANNIGDEHLEGSRAVSREQLLVSNAQIGPSTSVKRGVSMTVPRGRSKSIPANKSTTGLKTTGQNYDRNVVLAQDDLNSSAHDFVPRRHSVRVSKTVQMYNLAEIKCFICEKKFCEAVPVKFFDGRIACSLKCLQNSL